MNPHLIFTRKHHTVDYRTLIDRLENAVINLSEQNRLDLDALRGIRNSIEHHQINESRSNKEYNLLPYIDALAVETLLNVNHFSNETNIAKVIPYR